MIAFIGLRTYCRWKKGVAPSTRKVTYNPRGATTTQMPVLRMGDMATTMVADGRWVV